MIGCTRLTMRLLRGSSVNFFNASPTRQPKECKMSTAESPQQETAERVAEASPMLAFPRMIELIHHNRSRKAYRNRIDDAHRMGVAAMKGVELPDPIESEVDDMGDSFSIAGDTVHHHYPASKPMGTLAKAALAAALLGTGAGGGVAVPWLLGLLDQQQPPAVVTPADSSTQVIVE